MNLGEHRMLDAAVGPAAMGLRCSWCSAAPGRPCVTRDPVTLRPTTHAAALLHVRRLRAAERWLARHGKTAPTPTPGDMP